MASCNSEKMFLLWCKGGQICSLLRGKTIGSYINLIRQYVFARTDPFRVMASIPNKVVQVAN